MSEGPDLLIRGAAQLLTMDGSGEDEEGLGIIEDAALAASGGKVLWVGRTGELPKEHSSPSRTVEATSRVVMPGLIDPHTHLIFAGTREEEFRERALGRSYREIAARGGGIKATVRATREAPLEELVRLGLERLDRMLEFGVTTVEVKSGYGLSPEAELKSLEAISELNRLHPLEVVPTFMGAHEVPEEYEGRRGDYLELLVSEMLPRVAEAGLAEFCDVFCEQGVFTREECRRVLEAAADLGLGLKVHADELSPLGGAELAAELGATSAEHLLHVSPQGIKMLSGSGTVAVLLPGTAFFLGLPYAPARALIEGGVRVALGTDFNPGSCMSECLPLMTTLACTQMKMSPAEALLAVTREAALALGRGDRLGRLAPGMQADLLILDIPNYLHLPYHFGLNHVASVIKEGATVFER